MVGGVGALRSSLRGCGVTRTGGVTRVSMFHAAAELQGLAEIHAADMAAPTPMAGRREFP